MYDPHQIWWEEITGPRRLVDAVCGGLMADRSVLLVTGSAFPWRWTFRGNVETALWRRDMQLISIDCDEDYDGGDIIELLIRQAAPTEEPAYMRCLDQRTVWLKKSGALGQKVIWLKGIPGQYQGQFLKFVRDYRSASGEEGLSSWSWRHRPSNLPHPSI